MNKQTEALRLADLLDTNIWEGKCLSADREAAAAELRRLHSLNAELLYSLKAIAEFIPVTSAKEGGAAKYSANVVAADLVRAAIAKAEGEQK